MDSGKVQEADKMAGAGDFTIRYLDEMDKEAERFLEEFYSEIMPNGMTRRAWHRKMEDDMMEIYRANGYKVWRTEDGKIKRSAEPI